MKIKKSPLVSVIINCYNGERYLIECLKSVKNQTYKNWEVIFWDNQSTDKSKKIYLQFSKDKRFKYFYAKKFTTLYQARNLALKKINGEIVTFLDTDDYWLPDKIEKQVDIFLKYKDVNLVYTNYKQIKKFFIFDIIKKKKLVLYSGSICNELLKDYSIAWLTVAIRNKKNFMKKNPFNEQLDMVSDYDFTLRFSAKNNIYSINQYLAVNRQHSNQLSRNKFFDQAKHYCLWYKIIKKDKKISNMKNFYFIKMRYEFYNAIQKINDTENFLEKLIIIQNIKNSVLKIKLIFFTLFSGIFIKYVMSL